MQLLALAMLFQESIMPAKWLASKDELNNSQLTAAPRHWTSTSYLHSNAKTVLLDIGVDINTLPDQLDNSTGSSELRGESNQTNSQVPVHHSQHQHKPNSLLKDYVAMSITTNVNGPAPTPTTYQEALELIDALKWMHTIKAEYFSTCQTQRGNLHQAT